MFRDVPACSRMFHVPGFIDAPGSKVIIPDPKLSRWIQSFYSLFKVIISDPKLLLRIQTYYSGSQSYYPGSKVITLDPKLLLWIQSSVLLPIQSFFKEL